MNIYGRPEGNSYGTENMLSDGDFEWLRDLTNNWYRSWTLLTAHREDAGGHITNLNAIVLLADGLEHSVRSRNVG